jgi:WD40 repeat protein
VIQFACPACARVIAVPPQAAGQRGRCPGCGATVTAPHDVAAPTVVGAGAPPPASAAAPRRLGRYVLEAELGRGGMGVVYRAQDEHLRRAVAIKTLLAGAGQDLDAGVLERFRREAEAAARLRHPGIVAVHEVGAGPDGAPFMVMDLVEGQSLARRLTATKAEDRLPLEDAVRMVRDVVRAIEHAHAQGVLHRDLKPQNVMIDASGRALVMDFGLAKLQGATQLTREGSMLGTPAYMPPEQVDGVEVDARSDVYSLGATLYHAITGRPPFEAQNQAALITAVITKEPVPPSQLNRRAQGDLETICLRALEKEPARRYPSAAALADDLDRWLEGEPVSARPLGPLGRLARRARRNKLVTGVLALAALALALGGGVALQQTLALRAEKKAAEARERERLEAEAARDKAHAAELQGALERTSAEKARADRTLARVIHERGAGALVEGRAREAAIYAATALSEAARLGAPARELATYRASWASASQGGCWRRGQTLVQLPSVGPITLSVSRDGRRAAFVGREEAALWSAQGGETPLAHPGPDWFRALAIGTNGRLFLSSRRGLVTYEPTGVEGLAVKVHSTELAVSPDGEQVAVALGRGGLGIFDLKTGTLRKVVPPPESGWEIGVIRSLAWVDDATVILADDSGISSFTPASGVIDLAFHDYGERTTQVLAVVPNGRLLANGTKEGFLRIWRRDPGKPVDLVAATAAHTTAIRAIAFSVDGAFVATRGQDGHVRVWNFHCGLQATFSFRSPPGPVAFLADGRLIVGTDDGRVHAFDLEGAVPVAHTDSVRGLSFSPDGAVLVTAGGDGRAIAWDAVAGPRAKGPLAVTRLMAPATSVVMETPQRFVVGLADGEVHRLDNRAQSAVRVGTHQGAAQAMVLAGAGRVLSAGQELRLWELGAADGAPPRWSAPHPQAVLGVAVDLRRGLAASACQDGHVRLWDLETGAAGLTLEGRLPVAVTVAFLPDGRVVAGAADGTLHVWDAAGKAVARVLAHDAAVSAIDVRGARLATGGMDGLVKVWTFDPRLEVIAELRRHRGPVHGVAFSPDDRWLASAGEDKGVRWWPLEEIFGGPPPDEVLRLAQDGTGLVIRVEQGEVDPTEQR